MPIKHIWWVEVNLTPDLFGKRTQNRWGRGVHARTARRGAPQPVDGAARQRDTGRRLVARVPPGVARGDVLLQFRRTWGVRGGPARDRAPGPPVVRDVLRPGRSDDPQTVRHTVAWTVDWVIPVGFGLVAAEPTPYVQLTTKSRRLRRGGDGRLAGRGISDRLLHRPRLPKRSRDLLLILIILPVWASPRPGVRGQDPVSGNSVLTKALGVLPFSKAGQSLMDLFVGVVRRSSCGRLTKV